MKMCKKTNYKIPNPRIDKCMNIFIYNLKILMKDNFKIVACCCGHNKYKMSIIIKRNNEIYDLVSGETILRTRNFYKRDKQGYYYIPEVKCLLE